MCLVRKKIRMEEVKKKRLGKIILCNRLNARTLQGLHDELFFTKRKAIISLGWLMKKHEKKRPARDDEGMFGLTERVL